MKTSMKVSLGGVVAALSLVLMFLTSVIPFGTFAFPTFAGILLILLVINLGYRWAFAVYFITAVLSFLLLADKEAALYYAAFLGFGPAVYDGPAKPKNPLQPFNVDNILGEDSPFDEDMNLKDEYKDELGRK